MSKVIAFTAPFAVYKATMQKGRKTACLWAGYLADRATRKVVWDDGTITEYGPTTTEDAAFYSDACLAVDMAEGRLVYEAVERLLGGTAAAEVESSATSSTTGVVHPAVVEAVEVYYGKPVRIKKPWLTWLEGCIKASKDPGKLFHSTRGLRALPRGSAVHHLALFTEQQLNSS